MSKPDYTALDAAILAAIKEKQPAMFHVFAYDGDVKAKSWALTHTEKNGDAWRVTDRRLQALRKAGQVHYQRKPEGWVIAAQASPAPAPLPDAQALQQARWEGIRSAQVQTAEIVRAALELLDSVGEGLPPDALAAFKRVFGGAAPAVAAPEPLRAAAQAVLDRWNSPRWEWAKQGSTADLMQALADALAAPTTKEPQHG